MEVLVPFEATEEIDDRHAAPSSTVGMNGGMGLVDWACGPSDLCCAFHVAQRRVPLLCGIGGPVEVLRSTA